MYNVLENKKKYIKDIINIDKTFYPDKYLWTINKQLALFNKNPNSFVIIGFNNKPIGYLNFLCITKEKYEEMKNSNITIDSFNLDDILLFTEGDNYITINSVVILKEHQNKEVITLINDNFLKILKELENNNKIITGINGIAISNDGRKYLSNLGLIEVKELDDNNYLYLNENNPVDTMENKILMLKQKKR